MNFRAVLTAVPSAPCLVHLHHRLDTAVRCLQQVCLVQPELLFKTMKPTYVHMKEAKSKSSQLLGPNSREGTIWAGICTFVLVGAEIRSSDGCEEAGQYHSQTYR
jgi:hypothetical protein